MGKIDSQWEFAVWDGGGLGERRYIILMAYSHVVWQEPTHYCKTIVLQSKKKKKKKKIQINFKKKKKKERKKNSENVNV